MAIFNSYVKLPEGNITVMGGQSGLGVTSAIIHLEARDQVMLVTLVSLVGGSGVVVLFHPYVLYIY